MSARRVARRILVVIAVVLMVGGGLGFAIALALNAFLFDKYNAYGEVPIPGTSSIHLPAGEVTINLHTQVISSPSGGGLPVPPLSLRVQPPDGVAQPAVEESVGGTTTVNNDAHRRLWRMHVVTDGEYRITTDGQVGGFIAPRLAFGHGSRYGSAVWVFAGMFGLGALDLMAALWLLRGSGRPRISVADVPDHDPETMFSPDATGVRLEQLKTITALRDSGALTQREFEAEKRRILDGP